MRHARVESELITFAYHESASARPGERLVGSSEVEESVFGKLKALEGVQCSSGFTRYVLSIGAVVGDWSEGTQSGQAAGSVDCDSGLCC